MMKSFSFSPCSTLNVNYLDFAILAIYSQLVIELYLFMAHFILLYYSRSSRCIVSLTATSSCRNRITPRPSLQRRGRNPSYTDLPMNSEIWKWIVSIENDVPSCQRNLNRNEVWVRQPHHTAIPIVLSAAERKKIPPFGFVCSCIKCELFVTRKDHRRPRFCDHRRLYWRRIT